VGFYIIEFLRLKVILTNMSDKREQLCEDCDDLLEEYESEEYEAPKPIFSCSECGAEGIKNKINPFERTE
jgi:hypothetical protein